MSLKEGILGSGALAVISDGFLNSFDLIFGSFDVIMGSIDLLYPIIIVLNRVAPSFEWLDQQLVTNLMIVIALLYLVHLINKLRKRLNNE